MVVPSALFAAVGTAGQRCTTARRLVSVSVQAREVVLLFKPYISTNGTVREVS